MKYLLALTLLLTPTYAVRISMFGIPTNFLMLWVFFFWIIFIGVLIFKNQVLVFFEEFKKTDQKIIILSSLFLLAGTFSLFYGGLTMPKLGQYIVLFLQPVFTFFIAKFIYTQNPNNNSVILYASYVFVAASGILALVQYITLLGLPTAYWGNSEEPKRAVAFFTHPNFYALWISPILAFLAPDVFNSFKEKIFNDKTILWGLGAIGLFLSLSRAGWLGLAAALAIYLIIAADRKVRRVLFIFSFFVIAIILATPNFRYRLLLPFYGEKSAVSRISLWETGTKAIKESPVFGLGLTGFSQNWYRLNTDPGLDTHNFPHNIFLDFWVETGILGLLSFIGTCAFAISKGIKNKTNAIKLGVALFIITILAQGQLDNPYFKNDLALIFWVVISLI